MALDLPPAGLTKERLAAVPIIYGVIVFTGVAAAAYRDDIAGLIKAAPSKGQDVINS
jgi:hypothetical protein